jgi:hypothetical protein
MLLEVLSVAIGMVSQSPDTLVVRADNPPVWGENVRVTEELRSLDDDARIWVAVYAEARFVPYSPEEKAGRGDRPGLEWNQPLDWEVLDPDSICRGRVLIWAP